MIATTMKNGTHGEANGLTTSLGTPPGPDRTGLPSGETTWTMQDVNRKLWRMAIRVSGTQMTITYLGLDQIGIMAHVTELLIRDGRRINIEESNCFRMNGVNSSFFNLSGSESDLNWLAGQMQGYDGTEPFPDGRQPVAQATYDLKIIAPDRPGIINTVSRLTTENGINIANQVSDTVDLVAEDIDRIDLIDGPRRGRTGGRIAIIHWRIEIPSEEARKKLEGQISAYETAEGWRSRLKKRCEGPPEPSLTSRVGSVN